MFAAPGVGCRPRAAPREFRGDGLSKDDAAQCANPRDDGCVALGGDAFVDGGAVGGWQIHRGDDVFHAHWNATEGTRFYLLRY